MEKILTTVSDIYGKAFTSLEDVRQVLVVLDVAELYTSEVFDCEEDAVYEHNRRIGGSVNLASYADVLFAGFERAKK